MKYSVLALLFYMASVAVANATTTFSVTKKVTKTFAVTDNEKLVLNNEYGDVKINTWGKKQIEIKITVLAEASTTASAKQLAARVKIFNTRSINEILCKTNILGVDTLRQTQDMAIGRCTVTYIVYMPANLALKVTNQFGNIQMDSYNGHVEIDEKYGDFSAENIEAIDTLHLELGNISIKKLRTGSLSASAFGEVKIDTVCGNVLCNFTSGKASFIGLVNGRFNFTLLSKNVGLVNFNLAKNFSTNLGISAILTKLVNNSRLHILEDSTSLKDTHKRIRDTVVVLSKPKDTTTTMSNADKEKLQLKRKKLLAELWMSKKPITYHCLSGDGSANIKINVAFSLLNFKEDE